MKYSNIRSALVKVGVKADSFNFEDGQLILEYKNISLSDYLETIEEVTINLDLGLSVYETDEEATVTITD